MAAATGTRKTFSIHDYPEHLNPFREDDNHNKIRFWTIGRKLNRSNSISFSGLKDIKNSWAFRSFMRKGKKGQDTQSNHKKQSNQVNGESSPILYRRALQYSSASTTGARSTIGSPERSDRYVYGGSVTPLPRSRFQERLRSSSQHEVSLLSVTPRMARSEVSGSRLSVESTNPFEEMPVPPVRASRRKKKRAPLPPPPTGAADVSISSENTEKEISGVCSEKQTTEADEKTTTNNDTDLDIDELNLNVELKIVEDEDIKTQNNDMKTCDATTIVKVATVENVATSQELRNNNKELEERDTKMADPTDDVLSSVPFPKIDIVKYRRNSSVNDDDIRLRRGNLEDFHSLSNKRSKSLTNTLDTAYVTYDINLNENNENTVTKDKNGNEEPQKVICKLNETSRKQSVDNSISSTEKDFLEIDKVRKEFEKEINKLNAALAEDDFSATDNRVSVSEIRRKFDKTPSSPNPIPKPRRSHYGEPSSPVNGNIPT